MILSPIFTGLPFTLVNQYPIVGTHPLSRYAHSLNHSLEAIYDAVSQVNDVGSVHGVHGVPAPLHRLETSIGFPARSTASKPPLVFLR